MHERQDTHAGTQDNVPTRRYGGHAAAPAEVLSVVPRVARPLGKDGPLLAGTILLGVAWTRAGRWMTEVFFVEDGRLLHLTARFPDRETLTSFERKLALRAGPRFGKVADDRSTGSLHLMLVDHQGLDVDRPVPSVTFDAVGVELRDFVAGHPLDETRLYGTAPAFERVLECRGGSVWRKVMTFAGAMDVTMECLHPVAQHWLDEASVRDRCEPASVFYVMSEGGPRGKMAAVVEIPHPKSGYPPVVGGPMGKDAFKDHSVEIAELSEAIGVELRPEHRLDLIASPETGLHATDA